MRAFALALVVGTMLGGKAGTEAAPLFAALVAIAGVSSVLEWGPASQSRRWIPVGEAFLVAILLSSAPMQSSLLAYLAVPPLVAGVRFGWVTTVNASFVAAVTTLATLAVTPNGLDSDRLLESAPWVIIGMGVGLLASWQSRSMRDVEARRAPHAAANHLVSQLHALTTRGVVGLDSVHLAAELETALRAATGATRSAIHIYGERLKPELLSSYGEHIEVESDDDLERQIDPRVASLRLQSGEHHLGTVLLMRDGDWSLELRERAHAIANDFVLRLHTAVLFDDVRLMATADERNRIAREMHDGVAQEIVALGYIVDEIESVSEHTETRDLAATLRAEISRVVTELRLSIFDLRHQIADRRISAALAEYVREISHGSDLRVHLLLDESGQPLPSRTQMELLRIAQEAISNVRKHAHARNLWVTLVHDSAGVRLEIEDDGAGNAAPRERHWGLQTMRERAATIGADLSISDRGQGGTVVRLQTRPPVLPERIAHEQRHTR